MKEQRETLEEYIKRTAANIGPFRPAAFYSPESDILQVYLRPDQDHSVSLGGGIDVHLSQEDGTITGVTLWGIKKLLRDGSVAAERLVEGTEVQAELPSGTEGGDV
jgi:uncharacterized protein YuzE